MVQFPNFSENLGEFIYTNSVFLMLFVVSKSSKSANLFCLSRNMIKCDYSFRYIIKCSPISLWPIKMSRARPYYGWVTLFCISSFLALIPFNYNTVDSFHLSVNVLRIMAIYENHNGFGSVIYIISDLLRLVVLSASLRSANLFCLGIWAKCEYSFR